MDEELSIVEARVLGALMEKAVTTPEYYPLTLNALVAACNQKTSRDPVMDLGEDEVLQAVDALRARGWVFRVDVAGSRVPKFRHALREKWELDPAQLALLTVLLLRGEQTAGQLKQRCERMHLFRDPAAVVESLHSLMDRPDEPRCLVAELPHQPGSREARYRHTLMPEAMFAAQPSVEVVFRGPTAVEELRSELESVKEELTRLREAFEAFRNQFG